MPAICRLVLLSLITGLAGSAALAGGWDEGPRNAPDLAPAFAGQTRAPQIDGGLALTVETLVGGLEHPWGIAVLPDGSYLVTERGGRLNHIAADGGAMRQVTGTPEVFAEGQGGLLDVALAEDFATSRTIYLTYAKPMGQGLSATAAARAVLAGDHASLSGLVDIFVQEPPSPTPLHYGSRILAAGGQVWITTGEHSSEEESVFAQDLSRSYGKVIRLLADGSLPPDNPFGGDAAAIWTLGHRNMQGAALRPGGAQLWVLEHGPKGGDELNLIEKGANYGWPEVSYGTAYSGAPVGSGAARAAGFAEPRYFWDPVIAPGGFVFYDGAMFAGWQGDILAASLSPGGLVRLVLEGDTVVGEERFLHGAARLRDVEVAVDGAVLVLVDAEDGSLLRLTPAAAD